MCMFKTCFIFAIAVLLSSCAVNPYRETNKANKLQAKTLAESLLVQEPLSLTDSAGNAISNEWVGTVNFNLRKPNYVIIHHTAQDSVKQTLKTFTLVRTQVSAHYVIAKDGKIFHMLNDYLRAYHAGLAKWGNQTDINSSSIGIELDNNGRDEFTKEQINHLIILLDYLKKKYAIPTANFIGHGDIAPTRKQDPSIYFPWQKLAEKGFGFWYKIPDLPVPITFDTELSLRRIGYDTSNLNAAVIAFKRHFVPSDKNPVLTGWDKTVLWNLQKKY